jgi:hypothetical protein
VNSAPSRRGGWGLAALSAGCCALLLAAAWVLEDEDCHGLPSAALVADCLVDAKGPRYRGEFEEEMARRETHRGSGGYSTGEAVPSAI